MIDKNKIEYDINYIKNILLNTKSIAIVGLSDKENRPSNFAAKYLQVPSASSPRELQEQHKL